MQYISTALILVGAAKAIATPVNATLGAGAREYVELHREPALNSNGSIVFYGFPEGSQFPNQSSTDIAERTTCASTVTPDCSNKNTARNEGCQELINELYADYTVDVGENPRQICYEGVSAKQQYCCISWSKKVPNLKKGDLAPLASTIASDCTESGISGKMKNVLVWRTCSNLCLSDRGTHCS